MRKSQLNVFLILGVVFVMVFGLVIYAASKVTKKQTDNSIESIALSPGQNAPVRTYAENLLYILGEKALFNEVGMVTHDYLPDPTRMAQIVSDYITSNFDARLELSGFESGGMKITKQPISGVNVSINPTDVTITLNYPWTIKTGSARSTIHNFKTILFVRLGTVYNISEYLDGKITAGPGPYVLTPEDCNAINSKGGTDGVAPYVAVTTEQASGVVTITDYYTEKLYFQNPFVFKFKAANVGDGHCP